LAEQYSDQPGHDHHDRQVLEKGCSMHPNWAAVVTESRHSPETFTPSPGRGKPMKHLSRTTAGCSMRPGGGSPASDAFRGPQLSSALKWLCGPASRPCFGINASPDRAG
jgi:hypothetical protein